MEKCITLLELWQHFSRQRKKQYYILFVLMLLGALAEAVSLSLVAPFLAAFASSENMEKYPLFQASMKILKAIFSTWIDTSDNAEQEKRLFLICIAAFFAIVALIAGIIRVALVWAGAKLSSLSAWDLSEKIFRQTLYKPYKIFIKQNSSDLISALSSKITLVSLSLSYSLVLLTSFVVALFISAALLWINPITALLAFGFFGIIYALLATIGSIKTKENGKAMSSEQNKTMKCIQEALGGFRDIQLDWSHEIFIKNFSSAENSLRRAHANLVTLAHAPRYVMETAGIILFISLVFYMTSINGGINNALPLLAALALGLQRLLPAMQQGYAAWSTISGYHYAALDIAKYLREPANIRRPRFGVNKLNFDKSIKFDQVSFRYIPGGPWILKDCSFEIQKGSKVGLVGKTGSGKSTCLDLFMGLIEPTRGQILIDGKVLCEKSLQSWQMNISHVPQSIYLADSSIAENIAFGLAPEKIDMNRVFAAAKQAQIATFIENLPAGYQSLVGERGAQISGGQRQRLGIARALYKKAEVLVLDEATSALDCETEASVMDAIFGLDSGMTILIVAHRLSSLNGCAQIIEPEKQQCSFRPFSS